MANRQGNNENSVRLLRGRGGAGGGASKITADGDCSHEIIRSLLLGRKATTNLDRILKSRGITLPKKGQNSWSYGFSNSHVPKWELDHSVQFSHSVMSDSLWPHELQHARLPCPSPIPRAWSSSCPSSWWCHPTSSSSVVPVFSCLQSFPASGSFLRSQFSTSGGQSIRASTSVLPMNIQDWFSLGSKEIDWFDLLAGPRDPQESSPTVQKHQFFGSQLCLWPNSHIHMWLLEKP